VEIAMPGDWRRARYNTGDTFGRPDRGKNVRISLREETERVGLYLYNCATDIELLVDVLARAIRKYQRD
jgi:selenocysteine lyase/cysteine desulfurase